jgi:hypothetical protein
MQNHLLRHLKIQEESYQFVGFEPNKFPLSPLMICQGEMNFKPLWPMAKGSLSSEVLSTELSL